MSLSRLLLIGTLLVAFSSVLSAGTKTWDGQHSTEQIDVTVVYFLPRDRQSLPDWRERLDYYCERVTQFHHREFGDQSRMKTMVHPDPFRSARTTEQLRAGDADFIFFRTLEEVNDTLKWPPSENTAFPILLVLSDINWRPLDDFYRLRPGKDGLEHEGNMNGLRHFPGATSGGARATYLAGRRCGWGLVSADGWRVPYTGSDCVVYHEGLGHTVGLPHPEPGNDSVMSFGQYRGWLSESYLDRDQKLKLGWQPPAEESKPSLYTKFRAVPEVDAPRPGQPVLLKCDWPEGARLQSLKVQYQTSLWGPWHDIESPIPADGQVPGKISLGAFDRSTPVSYRIDATLQDGQTVELWGYLQVRSEVGKSPLPPFPIPDLVPSESQTSMVVSRPTGPEVDLLPLIELERDTVQGKWSREGAALLSPKAYGARIELPYVPPEEYDLTAIVEPLDAPNGLIFGHLSGNHRFLTLLHYDMKQSVASAIENIEGRNVGNISTNPQPVFMSGRPSQVICSIRKDGVQVQVDGRRVIDWNGKPEQLSLGEYWETPHKDQLFLGAYDCRYRVTRLTLTPVSGEGHPVER